MDKVSISLQAAKATRPYYHAAIDKLDAVGGTYDGDSHEAKMVGVFHDIFVAAFGAYHEMRRDAGLKHDRGVIRKARESLRHREGAHAK